MHLTGVFLAIVGTTYLNVIQIIVSAVLVVVILLQVRGSGFGELGTQSVFRTRRGVEKTLFQATIVLAVVFILVSMWSVAS
ncbi:MAG: preprotein translocase subunit SecG [Dehalococcoidia bacterium]|jgi:preprotein translocase subunit SecG|nr:preprotein translocase subunit SecG [Dehalococcoidia bacterium]